MPCGCTDTSEHMISCDKHPRNQTQTDQPDLQAYHVLVKVDLQKLPETDQNVIKRHFFVRASSEAEAVSSVKASWHCTEGAMPKMEFTVKKAQKVNESGIPNTGRFPSYVEVFSL